MSLLSVLFEGDGLWVDRGDGSIFAEVIANGDDLYLMVSCGELDDGLWFGGAVYWYACAK